jgi:hypothetical protein
MVTAEAAIVLPLVALMSVTLAWLMTIGIVDVRVVDAARDAARSLARGDGQAAAVRAAQRSAGADASVVIRRDNGLVTVEVSRKVAAPGWLLVPAPTITMHATSSVEVEVPDGP